MCAGAIASGAIGREFPAAAGLRARHKTQVFFVYVLRSQSTQRFYTGQTSDIPDRILKHEMGLSPSTKGRGPWELVHQEAFDTRSQAVRRERELKTGKGREELKRLLAAKAARSSAG
jgi:putative endonuclease